MKVKNITIFQLYDPNTYNSDLPDTPYEIMGYRYIIKTKSVAIVSDYTFPKKLSCMVSARKTVRNLGLKYPDNFTMTFKEYANADFLL